MLALLHVPSRAFGAKVRADDEGNSGNECRRKLETPSNVADFANSEVGTSSQEDTERSPHLPRHDEATSNGRRGIFGGEDGNSHFLQAHADTEKHTTTCEQPIRNEEQSVIHTDKQPVVPMSGRGPCQKERGERRWHPRKWYHGDQSSR